MEEQYEVGYICRPENLKNRTALFANGPDVRMLISYMSALVWWLSTH